MSASGRSRRLGSAALVEAWRVFWFRPEPAYTLGLVRMAFGAMMVAWTLSLLPNLFELFSAGGVAPRQPSYPYQWGVFEVWTSDRALLIAWAILLAAAIAMIVGWHSRVAAVIVFLLVVSFEWRNPWVFNSGDNLIRIEALFLALAPCGAACSLDRRRSTGSFWSAQTRAPWTVRLMQIQLSLIYLSTVRIKMSGDAWPEGTAVSYALRLEDMLLLPTPGWLPTNALLMNAATWGSLALELSIGILVWNRRCRPWVLAAGVLMHTGIMITIGVGFFSIAMFVLYLAFVPADSAQRLPKNVKHLVTTMRTRLRRHNPRSETAGASPVTDGVEGVDENTRPVDGQQPRIAHFDEQARPEQPQRLQAATPKCLSRHRDLAGFVAQLREVLTPASTPKL